MSPPEHRPAQPEEKSRARRELTAAEVEQHAAALPPRDRYAIERHVRDGATQTEIARELGVSVARAYQLIRRAAARLRALRLR